MERKEEKVRGNRFLQKEGQGMPVLGREKWLYLNGRGEAFEEGGGL